jgi:prophage maintenance system killer protein
MKSSRFPFVDGNKRIALSAAIAFLELNGVEIELGPELGRDHRSRCDRCMLS